MYFQFRCNNGECIPGHLQCSGQPECKDGSDERNCRKFEYFIFWSSGSQPFSTRVSLIRKKKTYLAYPQKFVKKAFMNFLQSIVSVINIQRTLKDSSRTPGWEPLFQRTSFQPPVRLRQVLTPLLRLRPWGRKVYGSFERVSDGL